MRTMCGIVAYLGPRPAPPILLEGLRRLEYRGYDSAGCALLEQGEGVDSGLARADAALYEAKATGRDRIVFADGHSSPELVTATT